MSLQLTSTTPGYDFAYQSMLSRHPASAKWAEGKLI